MTVSIAALPAEVVNLMAAGEVIDSLAAAVRELAENALDAGATRIVISLDTDQWGVRVADNGAGMDSGNLQTAAAPHSTSKIRTGGDLQCIQSLGFRGEALHSLAQLATLEVASRPTTSSRVDQSGDMGWQGVYDAQGTCVDLQPVAIAPGTIVTAQQLFAGWPARRQALPPIAQQLRTIQQVIHHLALCHPQVTWQVQQIDDSRGDDRPGDDRRGTERPWFNIWAGKTARQILPQLVRGVQVGDLREGESGGIYWLLGLPDRCHRRRLDWVKVAINGRCVQVPELDQSILAGFRRTLPRDRFPLCFIHLRVPPEQIDWNRHPAKSEIYLHNLADWRDRVATAIDQAFRLNPTHLPEPLYSSRVTTLIKTAEAAEGYAVNRSIAPAAAPAAPPSALKAIAQLHNTYILAETPSGLCLIEQHIAHERVLYEQVCDRWAIVPLTPPLTINDLTASQVEQLQRVGLEVELFGEQVWVVRSAPELLAQRPDCTEALLELSLGGDLQTAQVATACRTAIRNGTVLSLPAMQTLLDQWQRTRNPRTCPHGRPICLTLEESSLSRFFRRHWVIGKSHGI